MATGRISGNEAFLGLFEWIAISALGRFTLFHNDMLAVAGYLGALIVGISFGIAWTPCVGPTLGAILTLAAVESGRGAWLLLIYSAGLAIHFLLAAFAFNGFLGFFQRFKRLLPAVQKAGGFVLVLMGVLLLPGRLTVLNTYALSFTPEWLLKWL